MSLSAIPVVALSEMVADQEADLFVLMTLKEQLTTRDGKPYFKVGFRDAGREVTFPIWGNSPFAVDCRDHWIPGKFYKLRAVYRESNYGPQLDIRKIREAVETDKEDGFDPAMCCASSRFDGDTMFAELTDIAKSRIEDGGLRNLVLFLLEEHRGVLLEAFAAKRHHHAFTGGLLEHMLSVTRNAIFLADRYADYYVELVPPLDKGLVIAGAILHDIGKVRELEAGPAGAEYTTAGQLIGHILQGRDLVREAAREIEIDADRLLRLEHVIISHQRLPEWGSPKPPMIPEAVLVHYADDIDAKFHQVVTEVSEAKPFSRVMGYR
ncbi:MAG: HD domain-containing protein [Planctomycetaceae bacterium]|nr:HD domain-containing protein [Planctomycetaceae bacterium]